MMKFTAASLVLCAAVISAWAASAARVLAGPIQFSTFAFADDGSPAFRYVGGDVPNVATAEITGYFVMAYDAESDFAWLSVLHGKLHTPEQVVGGGLNGAAWLDDAAIEDRMPGLFRQLWGERIEDSEFFLFGPVVTGNQEFVAHFVLSTDPSSPRLSGKATTLRDDGPSYFLDAPLTAIPEPATLSLVCCGALAGFANRRR